jgi:hypothetical protein
MHLISNLLQRIPRIFSSGTGSAISRLAAPFIRPGISVLIAGAAGNTVVRSVAALVGETGRIYTLSSGEKVLSNHTGSSGCGYADLEEHPEVPPETVEFCICIGRNRTARCREQLFARVHDTLRPAATLLLIVPVMTVRKRLFDQLVAAAEEEGFIGRAGPHYTGYRTALLVRTC